MYHVLKVLSDFILFLDRFSGYTMVNLGTSRIWFSIRFARHKER